MNTFIQQLFSNELHILISSIVSIGTIIWSITSFYLKHRYTRKKKSTETLAKKIFIPFESSIENYLFQKITRKNILERKQTIQQLIQTVENKNIDFYLPYELIYFAKEAQKAINSKKHFKKIPFKVQRMYFEFSCCYLTELNKVRKQLGVAKRDFFYKRKKKLYYHIVTFYLCCIFKFLFITFSIFWCILIIIYYSTQ